MGDHTISIVHVLTVDFLLSPREEMITLVNVYDSTKGCICS